MFNIVSQKMAVGNFSQGHKKQMVLIFFQPDSGGFTLSIPLLLGHSEYKSLCQKGDHGFVGTWKVSNSCQIEKLYLLEMMKRKIPRIEQING